MPKSDETKRRESSTAGPRWKKRRSICAFAIDADGIDSTVSELRKLLTESGYQNRDAIRLGFALDVLLCEWRDHGLKDVPAELFLESVFGQKSIVIEAYGKADAAEHGDLPQHWPWEDILNSSGLAWSNTQTNNGMRAELIISKRGMGSGIKFLIAIAVAIATVFALSVAPGDMMASANEALFDPLFNIGIGLLTALVGPMVFISIIASIIGVGDFDTLKRLGSRVLARAMRINLFGTLVALIGTVILIGSHISIKTGTESIGKALLDSIYAIIPTSFFQPFIDGNILHITVWAIVFGIGGLLLKSHMPVLGNVFTELNSLIRWAINVIARIMPIFVYLALVRFLSNVSGETMVTLLRLVIIAMASVIFIISVSIAFAARRRKMGFGALVKTMAPALTTAFLTSSTAASFTQICETMKKLAIEKTVLDFHISIAISTVHLGCILDFMLVVATAACLGGHSVGISQFLLMTVLCFILGIATPSAPGGAIAIYSMLLSTIGFSTASLPILVALSPILDMCGTTLNVACIITSGLQVDSDLKASSLQSME